MFQDLQDEYVDFINNEIILTYGAFGSKIYYDKKNIEKLPKHLWIANDVNPIGWSMFSFFEIPIGFSLPKKMKIIGYDMFRSSLIPNDFHIPSSIKKISKLGFYNSKFASTFRLPSTVQTISQGAFFKAKLPIGFQIPSTVKFDGNPFNKSVDIPNAHWDKEDSNTGYPLQGATLVANA